LGSISDLRIDLGRLDKFFTDIIAITLCEGKELKGYLSSHKMTLHTDGLVERQGGWPYVAFSVSLKIPDREVFHPHSGWTIKTTPS
jgi:hypothetical protein